MKYCRSLYPLCLIALFSVVVLSGCEDVIEVDLKQLPSQLVIEGNIVQFDHSAYFRITRTTDFDAPNAFEGVSGALIQVTSEGGTVYPFVESDSVPGLYYNEELWGITGSRYDAEVTVDGRTYTASSTMPMLVDIDSVRTEYQPGGGVGIYEDEGYRLHVYFIDYIDIHNYARIRLTKNSQRISNFYLYDGKYSDGNRINYEYFLDVFQLNDTVTVELISMDREMYDYFLTLSEVAALEAGGDWFDVTPSNPNTNWDQGALGYFGCFAVSRRRLVVRSF